MVSFGRSMWHLGFVWGFKGIERYVLGLLSSKTTDLDDEERVLELLEKASQILPKERLFLLTNVVSPHVTQVMSWQHLNNGLKSNKVKISLRNSLVN